MKKWIDADGNDDDDDDGDGNLQNSHLAIPMDRYI